MSSWATGVVYIQENRLVKGVFRKTVPAGRPSATLGAVCNLFPSSGRMAEAILHKPPRLCPQKPGFLPFPSSTSHLADLHYNDLSQDSISPPLPCPRTGPT